MNETHNPSSTRADFAWGAITRKTQSGSSVEDTLAGLVTGLADGLVDGTDTDVINSRFRVDVIYPDAAAAGPNS